MGDPIDIPGSGKFSAAPDASAPLIVVFGGIWVKGRGRSGVYMWDYMKPIEPRFHIFVANDNSVDGVKAYSSLTSKLQALSLTPSEQILYLFSGGYWPGMQLLKTANGPARFSSIYLVDIWMGVNTKTKSTVVPDFYKALVDGNAKKITYVYTSFGANNDEARDYIAKKLGSSKAILVKSGHMSTNTTAVNKL